METPKTSIVNIYSAGIENTLQNQVFMNSVKSILDMAYVKSLREDEGGTYGASVQAELDNRPLSQGMILIVFDTDPTPEKQAKMRQIVEADIMNIAKDGPSEEYVSKTKENMLKNRQENVINNNFWNNALKSYYIDGLDIVTSYDDIVKNISTKSIGDFLKDFIKQGNFIDLSMNPQE
jgi:zinc protease